MYTGTDTAVIRIRPVNTAGPPVDKWVKNNVNHVHGPLKKRGKGKVKKYWG